MATLSPQSVAIAEPAAPAELTFPRADALEHLLALPDEEPRKAGFILAEFMRSFILVLGSPAGEVVGVHATEINVLRYVAEMDGSDRTFIPVFTSVELARNASERNPDWESFHLLAVSGGDLVKSLDRDVYVAINPWSRLGYVLKSF